MVQRTNGTFDWKIDLFSKFTKAPFNRDFTICLKSAGYLGPKRPICNEWNWFYSNPSCFFVVSFWWLFVLLRASLCLHVTPECLPQTLMSSPVLSSSMSTKIAWLRNQSCKRSGNLSESGGHEAAEIGLGWSGIGGLKLIGNDSKCLEGGNF